MDGQQGCNTPHQRGHPNILEQERILFRGALCQKREDNAHISEGLALCL